MQLTDFVRDVPDDVWAVFEPILPPVVWKGNGRKPKGNRECLHGLFYVLVSGIAWEMLPVCFPSYKTIQRRLKRWLGWMSSTPPGSNWPSVTNTARHQLGSDPPRRLQEAVKKGGEETGPSPVDRAKSGTALHLACDSRAMPLGVVVTGANANDGVQTQKVLESLVIKPPTAEQPVAVVDERGLPGAIGDGGYGNKPSRAAGEGGRLPPACSRARSEAVGGRQDPQRGGAVP